MLLATWKGYGKRVKRGMVGRKFNLYGMTFKVRRPRVLTKAFIEEAGLDEKGIYKVVEESLRTDYGLYLKDKGHKFKKGKLSDKAQEIKRVSKLTPKEIEGEKEEDKNQLIVNYLAEMLNIANPSPPALLEE